ncbi:hypothetical protein TNIN_105781 [Trichonephila inaurata madagascariensis]|uniref:C2H2-type domain-containing protein n=1 Tax=Trichonephila inaurata madagascariensis TaxID=2747483 RepID=A0A8X6XXH4_9ARAC|nr:hypothetical protein TNIN_105781 [Trichonephila inaurata madagascariensis]
MEAANVNPTEEEFYYFCYQCRLEFQITWLSFISISSDEREFTCVNCKREVVAVFKVEKSDFDDCYPYPCEVCDVRFRTLTQLLHHSYLHSDALPFKCDFCQGVFPKSSLFNRHRVPKTLQCNKCSKSVLGEFCPARVFDEKNEFICKKCSIGSELPST